MSSEPLSPAHVDEVRRGQHGQMVEISDDVANVTRSLAQIDPGLRVRFAVNGNPPYWVVSHVSEENGRTTNHLVLTTKAWMNKSGTWEGLDQRVVERCRLIGSSSYDYLAELKKLDHAKLKAENDRVRGVAEDHADEAMAAIRKDLGRNTAKAAIHKKTDGL